MLPPLGALSRFGDLAVLRERMGACGYDQSLVSRAESILKVPVDAARLPIIQWTLARWATPGAVLARLWAYEDTVESRALENALGATLVASLIEAGVLVREGDRIRSTLRLMPFRGLWIFSDHMHAGAEVAMGPGGTTGEMAGLLPDTIEGSFLDVGCGAGTLALIAAQRGADEVAGVDINPRAIEMSRLNAALNDLPAMFESGDLLVPVGERRFDWIVSQPPYVMAPSGTPRVTYLHGGAGGTDVSARLLSLIPRHLEANGCALVLVDTPLDGGSLDARFRQIIDADDVDLIVLAAPGLSPEVQSMAYGTFEDSMLGPAYAAAATRYLEHFAERGITEFRHVALILRRRSGVRPGHALTVVVPVHDLPHHGGRSAPALLESLDLAARPEDRLLEEALSPSPWSLYRVERRRPALEEEGDHSVRFDSGSLGINQELSPASILLLEAIGEAPDLATAIEHYAKRVEGEAGELTPSIVEFVRRALGTGVLVPRIIARDAEAIRPSKTPDS